MSQGTPTRRWRKWLLWPLLVLLAIIVFAAALLMTGLPQRTLLTRVLGDALNANVEIKGLSLLSDIRMEELKAFDKNADASSPPTLDASGVQIGYTLLPPGERKRYVSSASIDDLAVNLDLSKRVPLAAARQPKSSKKRKERRDALRFVPEAVNITNMRFTVAAPPLGAQIAGIQLGATVEGWSDCEIRLAGSNVSGSCWAESREAALSFNDGSISVRGKSSGRNITIDPLHVSLPGLLEVTAHAQYQQGNETDIDVGFERFLVSDMDFSSASTDVLPVPFRFKKLDMSGTRIKSTAALKRFKASIADTRINVAAEDLVLGSRGHELYEGNLAISGAAGPSTDLELNLDTTLNRGQKLTTKLSGTLRDFGLHTSLTNWSREDLLAALPRDVRAGLEALPGLDGLAAAALDVNIRLLDLDATGSARPIFLDTEGAAEPVELSFDSSGSTPSLYTGSGRFITSARAKVGNGSVALSTVLGPAPRRRAKFTLERVEPARWLRAIARRHDLDALSTTLSGTVDIDASPDWKVINVAMDLSAPTLRYGTWAAPEGHAVKLTGKVTADNTTYWKLAIPTLDAHLGDQASVVLKDTTVDVESITVKSDLTAECDLSLLSHGLSGRAKFHAPIKNERGMVSADLALTVDGFAFGTFTMPVDAPVSAKGAVVYDNINGYTKGGNVDLKLGEGTSLALSNISYNGSPLRIETPFSLRSDMQPLVGMGWLDAAKGTVSASGVFKHDESVTSATCDLEVACESLAVVKGRGVLEGVSLKGALGWQSDKALSGESRQARSGQHRTERRRRFDSGRGRRDQGRGPCRERFRRNRHGRRGVRRASAWPARSFDRATQGHQSREREPRPRHPFAVCHGERGRHDKVRDGTGRDEGSPDHPGIRRGRYRQRGGPRTTPDLSVRAGVHGQEAVGADCEGSRGQGEAKLIRFGEAGYRVRRGSLYPPCETGECEGEPDGGRACRRGRGHGRPEVDSVDGRRRCAVLVNPCGQTEVCPTL